MHTWLFMGWAVLLITTAGMVVRFRYRCEVGTARARDFWCVTAGFILIVGLSVLLAATDHSAASQR